MCVPQDCQHACLFALADQELCQVLVSGQSAALQNGRAHATQCVCHRISWHASKPAAHPHRASEMGPSKLQRLAGILAAVVSSMYRCSRACINPPCKVHLQLSRSLKLELRPHKLENVIQVQPQLIPTPGQGEVLVRMRLRPVNPADCSLIQGRMGRPPLPLTPGAEGTALTLPLCFPPALLLHGACELGH